MAGEEGKSGSVGALAGGGGAEGPGGTEAGPGEGDKGVAGRGPWQIERLRMAELVGSSPTAQSTPS